MLVVSQIQKEKKQKVNRTETAFARNCLHRVSDVHSLGIWAILGELNHNLSAVDDFS